MDRCPDDRMLEDFALGRKAPGAIGEHVEACPACQEKAGAMRAEAGLFAQLLQCAHGGAEGPCLEDEQLALYLDGGPADESREAAERHLAACPECLHRLVRIHRLAEHAADASLDNPGANVLGAVPLVDQVPAGETIQLDERQAALEQKELLRKAAKELRRDDDDDERRKGRTLSERS